MINGGIGQVGQTSYKDAAARIAKAASSEFDVTPNKALLSKVLDAAVGSLKRSGSVDAESVRTALDAARSIFVKEGFSQGAFATKFGSKGEISGIKRFQTEASDFTKARMENGEAIVRIAKQLMGMTPDEAGPRLAGIIKKHASV